MGITVLPPDVNQSERSFAVVPRDPFGLAAVKNVARGDRVDPRGARATALHLALRLLHARRPAPGQQAGARGPRQVRRLRLVQGPPRAARGGARRGDGGRAGRAARPQPGAGQPLAASPQPLLERGSRTCRVPEHTLLATRRRRSASTSPGTRSRSSPATGAADDAEPHLGELAEGAEVRVGGLVTAVKNYRPQGRDDGFVTSRLDGTMESPSSPSSGRPARARRRGRRGSGDRKANVSDAGVRSSPTRRCRSRRRASGSCAPCTAPAHPGSSADARGGRPLVRRTGAPCRCTCTC